MNANAFIQLITTARDQLSAKINEFVPSRITSSVQLLGGDQLNQFFAGLLKRDYKHEEVVQMVEALARAEMNFSTLVNYVRNELREQKGVV